MITQLPLFDIGSIPNRAKKRASKMVDKTPTVGQQTDLTNDDDVATAAKTTKKKTATKPSAGPSKPATNGSPKKVAGKKEKKKDSKKESAGDEWRGKKRLFPQNSLEDALKVPQAIKEKNGGNAWAPDEVARACGMSAKTNDFYYLTASAQSYGLSSGTRNSNEISITDFGREIVYPESADEQRKKKVEAFFNVPLFKQVFEHYKGGPLPEMQFLSSRLKKLDVAEKDYESFTELFRKNYDYLKLSPGLEELQRDNTVEGMSVTVVGQKKGTYQHHAFIILPFSEKGTNPRPKGFFSEVLNSLLTPCCNSLNFRISTANISGSDLIHHTIMKNLIEADLVIADLTDHNPNVAFELGVRIALDKPVAIIRAKGMAPFFDVDNLMRVFEYDSCLWKSTIDIDIAKLTDHIKAAWENVDNLPSYMKILTASPNALAQAQAAV
jgi:hypothetical protein